MNSYKTTLLSAGAAMLLSASAHAATVSYDDSTSVTEAGALTGVNNISVSQFDSDLGTLTGVTLNISLQVPSFEIVVDNDSAATANVTAKFATLGGNQFASTAQTFNGTSTLSGSNFTITTQASTFDVQGNDTDLATQFDDDGGPDSGSFTTTAVDEGVSGWSVSSSFFNDWQSATPGNVTFDLAVDFTTDLDLNSGGGGGQTRFEGVIPSATFSAEVIYTYDANPIPEPGAAAALAVACSLGFLMLRRRGR